MKVTIRRMGNSRGLIIPKPVLQQTGLDEEVELSVEGDCIVLRKPVVDPRAGWAQASREIAAAGDDEFVWPEFGNDDDSDLAW